MNVFSAGSGIAGYLTQGATSTFNQVHAPPPPINR
jgi:hypothetical protein